ncbi:ran-binding protein 9-like isoform X2 [Paramacrobiotus metropolitanus]|nr:ran-binding protein 9-like isoform X2 [Paramacrobiotus metropolitanus]XP_055343673.1 ran-binding protein 9-like isoform X2 [Paramacrobiotus metropolitanus]
MEQRLAEMYPWVNQQETPIPVGWSTKDRHTYITIVGANGLRLQYKGPGKSQKDASAIRATHPIPASCGLFYFEVKVISKGKEGYIGVGLCLEDVNLNRLPGWDKGSFGYHGDDGHSFWSSGTGRSYGPTFTTNDVIGCGVDLVNNSCFYTKNGLMLGVAFENLPSNLYPCVGLQSVGENVETNFGQTEFMFDLTDLRKELRKQSRDMIAKYHPKLTRGEWEQAMQRIVSDYLVHNGYYSAAESFAKSTGIEIKEQITSMSNRQTIQKLILDGKISEAIALTQDLYPGLLEKNPNLLFRLKVRQFIEMVTGCDPGHASDSVTSTHSSGLSKSLRHSRTPSPNPRDIHRKHDHSNGSVKEERPNGLGVVYDNLMETEIVSEDGSLDNDMDVDCLTSNGASDYHVNGATQSNGTPQAMDFEDEDEENRVPVGNPILLTRILTFGKQLQEFYTDMRMDQGRDSENQKLLSDAFSFIAYEDPWKSPNRHMLEQLQREPVCAALNSAILGADRQSSHPALKIIVAHLKRLFPLMAKKGSGAIAFTNVFELLRSLETPQPALTGSGSGPSGRSYSSYASARLLPMSTDANITL